MERIPDELHLSQSYQFIVTIENNGTHFAGELSLAPEGCTLIIRGDISEDRQHTLDMDGLSELACNSFSGSLLLLGLKGEGGHIHHIARYPKSVSHFEIRYRISHVIYSRAHISRNVKFLGIELDSPSIAKWVGYTNTQDEIVGNHTNNTLFPCYGILPSEFQKTIDALGELRVIYRISTHHSVEAFNLGLRYPPALSLSFEEEKTADQIIENVNELETLFSFLLGKALDLNRVKLTTLHERIPGLSLYFPRAISRDSNRDFPLFPLGRNLRIDHFGLPEFPLDSFSIYFNLAAAEKMHFKKYIKYREMENPEERFLGFFRLLEKLCSQEESFLSENKLLALIERATPFLVSHFGDRKNVERLLNRLVGLNRSKLNTEGCIVRFIKKISPDLLSQWIYGPSNIGPICKLRNDLTHANEVEPEECEIEKKAKFIETLLIISLLTKIEVSIDSAALIAKRIKSHHLIETPPKITFSTSNGN
ncbi:hypothetical protein LT85_3849 [Collimonas arenae]|uniref:ApeA N-terminal domain-containing protein n=1 Tax=Collimonas arenae TaxID=279058 RepID=A0A0A1FJC4_9BURK|nr:hypothetical protein [Collimonas arenae]AIY43007.1 hypothetical protein LT85_3849 [Collimonas arenae]